LAIESGNSLTDAFTTTCTGENPGDLPAPFVLSISGSVAKNTVIAVGNTSITVGAACYDLEWDSKTGIVEGMMQDYTIRQINYEGNALCSIPINQHQNVDFIGPQDMYKTGYKYCIRIIELDYQFWYY
jgi:hypothetical protein